MKRIFALLCFLTSALLTSCECSNKPPVPPVDEERRAADVPYVGSGVEAWT